MRIGIFDSGLGGLIIAKNIFAALPQYNFTYLGDTKNVPYGGKNQKEIFELTKKSLKFLFDNDCELVIIACNTSSAKALRKIQRKFLPKLYPDKKVLGVIVPTLESIPKTAKKIGVIATKSAVASHAYKKEFAKINPKIKIFEQAAPQLVPFIENNTINLAASKLPIYLQPLLNQKIDTLILGCTHYPILKKQIKKLVGAKIKIISQEEIIPKKLKIYLKKHPEIELKISKQQKKTFIVTKVTPEFNEVAKKLFGKPIQLKLAGF